MNKELARTVEFLERPVFGAPETPLFGRVMGSLAIDGPEQAQLLQSVLEDGLTRYAGRHEETFLRKIHHDLVEMQDRARTENWTGWYRQEKVQDARG